MRMVLTAWKTAELKDHVPGNSLFKNDIQPSSYIIDSTKSLYIGYVMSDYPLYPAGCDNGPALDGLGNVIVLLWRFKVVVRPH